MGRHLFVPGTHIKIEGVQFLILEILANNNILMKNNSLGGKCIKSLGELEQLFFDGKLQFEERDIRRLTGKKKKPKPLDYSIRDFDVFSDSVRAEAWRRYSILRPILDWPKEKVTRSNIKTYVESLIDDQKRSKVKKNKEEGNSPRKGVKRGDALSVGSVERWLKRYLESGQDMLALIHDSKHSGAPGGHRLDSNVEDLISEIFEQCKNKPKVRTRNDVHLMIVHRIGEANQTLPEDLKLENPSKQTINNRIDEVGPEFILQRRKSRVEKQASEPVKAGPFPTRIQERAEFDGTWMDVIVVDEEDRLPIGRPFISIAFDVYSRYPLGFYVSYEPPSYKTTMSCAMHSFSRKPDIQKLYGTKHPWYARGLPGLAVIDNGREYVNQHLMDAFGRLGITVDQCPVKTPWLKGTVERYFRTINTNLVHALPGSTFSNVLERGDYDSSQFACISLSSFIKILHIYFLDYYAQKWNEGAQGVPETLWLESERSGFLPVLAASQEELKILLYWNETRTLNRQGISFETIQYQSTDSLRLRTMLKSTDRKVKVRVNPDDLSYIYILDPISGSEWIKFLPNDPKDYTKGLSIWKHRIIRDMVNKEKKKVNLEELAEAKARIQQIVDDERNKTKKQKRRKRNHRLDEKFSKSVEAPDYVVSKGQTVDVSEDKSTSEQDNKTRDLEENRRKNASSGTSQDLDHPSNNDELWHSDYGLPQG